MTFLYAILRPYCERKGMRLLNDDFKFIERCLSYIPENAHRAIMRDYVKLYLSELQKGANAPSAQNLARRKANTWLRMTCGIDLRYTKGLNR